MHASLRQAIDVMELRMGIEIEAAGLAAERGTLIYEGAQEEPVGVR